MKGFTFISRKKKKLALKDEYTRLQKSLTSFLESAPKAGSWVICPVCHEPNPSGTEFCEHCWGAIIHTDSPVLSYDEMKEAIARRLSYLKRRKTIKVTVLSVVSLIVLVSILYPSLYYYTDTLFKPPQSLNSNSGPGEWAMFRHDLGHTGITDSSGALPQGTLKWVFSTGDSIHSSPAVADGTVYVGSRDSKLYALDAATGAKRWEYETGSWVESSPAIANGVVYFGSNDGKLYALDAQSGEKLWDFKTRYPIMSSPAVADGIVYFGADDYYIYAVDAVEGIKLWDFNTKGLVKSSPAVADGIVYTGSGGSFCYSLHALDARQRLFFKTHYPANASPVVSNGTVYFTTISGYLFAVDSKAISWPRYHEILPTWIQLSAWGMLPIPPPQSGQLWSVDLRRATYSSPVVTDDTLYIGSGNRLLAIDLQSHQKRWAFEIEDTISSSPAVVATTAYIGTIYVGSEDGRLYAVDAATGIKLWDFVTGGKVTSSPAVADGTIYIGSHDGNLYAIK